MSSRARLHKLLAVVLISGALPCVAQLQVEHLQLDVIPDAALVQSSRNAYPSLSAQPLQSSAARSFYGNSHSSSSWLGSAVQLEAPRPTTTGQYTRPKYHVGLPSEAMRNFLNSSAGLGADKCQLPMVRARTNWRGEGDFNGTLWLYARCTFR